MKEKIGVACAVLVAFALSIFSCVIAAIPHLEAFPQDTRSVSAPPLVGYDGSVYNRAKVNTSGSLITDVVPATLCQTGTAASGSGVTITLPAVAGQFHYITRVQLVKFSAALLTAAATPVLVTTTNIPSTPTFSMSAGAEAQGTEQVLDMDFGNPVKSSVVNTATTIVAPATTNVIWRINVFYYTAP